MYILFFLMNRRPPRSTRTDTLVPYTTLFRSVHEVDPAVADDYFASRSRDSQLGALASDQSRPLASRGEFLTRIAKVTARHLVGSVPRPPHRSEEHTSELQSLMRISYAVFCLQKKQKTTPDKTYTNRRST